MIKGAGVILWRERRPLELEVALIHRPRYDDWSFPKGSVETDENPLKTAYRECLEETGIDSILGSYIGDVTYEVTEGKKRIHYWMAKANRSITNFTPNEEVDQLAWTSIKEARHFLTHEDDKQLLTKFVRMERYSNVLILLRHGKAVKREEWFGEDTDRPLSHKGQMQSKKLSNLFQAYGITEIHSSDAQRCLNTAESIARELKIEMKATPMLSEDMYEKDDNAAIDYVIQILKFNKNQIVCSHNPMFTDILFAFENHRDFSRNLPKLSPADAWVIHHQGNRIISAEALPAPRVEKSAELD